MDGLRKIFYSENAEEEGNEISFHELFKLILESTEYFMEKIVTARSNKFKIHLVQKLINLILFHGIFITVLYEPSFEARAAIRRC